MRVVAGAMEKHSVSEGPKSSDFYYYNLVALRILLILSGYVRLPCSKLPSRYIEGTKCTKYTSYVSLLSESDF